ncbi:MAG: endonuclease/exonuclease/phosphatase family protein [Bacteroidales bacterium]|nr:endonuclease/exonuclease/phosphatase family protein [Bacteroidales bacterium]
MPLIAIIVTFKFIINILPIQSYLTPNSKVAPELKIMTYNVKVFGLYNWNDNSIKPNILNLIKTENPDILCLQEAYWNNYNNNFITVDSIVQILNTKFIYKIPFTTAVGKQNFGLVIVSKYPIINTFSQKFEKSSNGFAFADVVKENDTIRIFNCHLQSIHFGKDDYAVIEQLNSDSIKNSEIKGFKNVLIKYLKSCRQRATQADLLKNKIDSCNYQKFVCGDFNDIPNSYSYNQIKNNLSDSYVKRGHLSDFTWKYSKIKQRIDYIFFDDKYKCISHKVIKKNYSDHFAVVGEFCRR